ELERKMIQATSTQKRIKVIEDFLLSILHEQSTIDNIVKNTVDTLVSTNGSVPINAILKDDLSSRRKLERNFRKQIGISPKQLGRVIRLQAALHMLLNKDENLTSIAYESEYFDQAHFIKDFKEFTGITPKEFSENENMELSKLFYQ
ncbi:MAG: helix-turn-helix domain-containing protein, partial [Bacteroidota bacterium]